MTRVKFELPADRDGGISPRTEFVRGPVLIVEDSEGSVLCLWEAISGTAAG